MAFCRIKRWWMSVGWETSVPSSHSAPVALSWQEVARSHSSCKQVFLWQQWRVVPICMYWLTSCSCMLLFEMISSATLSFFYSRVLIAPALRKTVIYWSCYLVTVTCDSGILLYFGWVIFYLVFSVHRFFDVPEPKLCHMTRYVLK